MKIGLFMPTVNNGFIMSEAAPQYAPDFDYNKEVVVKAERYGMEFALGLVKYRGFGGKTDHWHWALDSFTTIAGDRRCHGQDQAHRLRRAAGPPSGRRRSACRHDPDDLERPLLAERRHRMAEVRIRKPRPLAR